MTACPVQNPLRVLVGICGGIAAYKAPHIVRLLRKNGCETKVVLTQAARPLVGEEALRTVSGGPVYRDDTPSTYDMDHIRLAEWAAVMLICPATANTIAKIAHGIADNLLTTLALSFEGPILLAPAMNSAMLAKPATQENLALLEQQGVTVLPVEEGELACGTTGPGRMLEIEKIVDQVLARGGPRLLEGRRVLIASGPTSEPLDSVRVITNRSSGKMGRALALEAVRMGAEVTVVSGPSEVKPPAAARIIAVTTTAEMSAALSGLFESCDVCIMAAAVSDFRPHEVSSSKLNRRGTDSVVLQLVANADILAGLGTRKRGQFLVGFALEDSFDTQSAVDKLREKNCDMMVLNQVATSLGTDTSTVVILDREGRSECVPVMDKTAVAREILTRIASRVRTDNG